MVDILFIRKKKLLKLLAFFKSINTTLTNSIPLLKFTGDIMFFETGISQIILSPNQKLISS